MKFMQSEQAPNGLVTFLESITFGTDGLRYQRLDVARQMQRLNHPVFFSAWSGTDLVGSYILDRRNLMVHHQPMQGYYRGALAVHPSWQGKAIATKLTGKAMRWQEEQSASSLSYGCIDKENLRSLKVLSKHGAEFVAHLNMLMLYRQWPRKQLELVPLDDQLKNNEDQLSAQTHKDCSVRDITVHANPGYALTDHEGIAISARVALTAFRIMSMSRFAIWSTRLFVTPWPPARRRFNPNHFSYLSLSNVLIRKGCESKWPAFVSTIMASHNVHFAAVYLDSGSSLFQTLRASQPLGRLRRNSKGNIHIVATFNGDSVKSGAPWHVWPVDA
ncbi:MAG: GNAT family N-acetyltransferase [Granulosicoccus sp.]|nr:GNAT family N-acetyltransferase [Granulosicoccus sp.]